MSSKKLKKAPLERCGGTMTESQYLSWIRSALRSKSLRWPPRAEALKLARRAYKGPNKLQKWEYCCALCGEWWKMKDVIVDHHPVAAGSILSVEDIGPFANNLYCEVDNLRVLDKVCHDVHTLSEAHRITFEEARKLKVVIDLLKPANKSKMQALLDEHGYVCKNPAQRRAALSEIMEKTNV
jgi:hypothetical protein